MYKSQIDDMIIRGVARKLSRNEIDDYDGPTFYIPHHEVIKRESESTPCRIVFNTSAKFHGHIINDYWAKGPTLMRNLLGVIIRFREEEVAVTGDIKKMYHSVKLSELDQHTHRFLWRDLDTEKYPDTYVVSSVSFGDRPAGTIAMLAMKKTLEVAGQVSNRAAEMIRDNSYVDDIIDSFSTKEEAVAITDEVDAILAKGGFEIKKWIIISAENASETEEWNDTQKLLDYDPKTQSRCSKVIGIYWHGATDKFRYTTRLNFSPKRRKIRTGPDLIKEQVPQAIPPLLTKRMILSQVNGIYDPIGLANPFTVKAKILLRKLWSNDSQKLGWDDPVSIEARNDWMTFFREMFDMEKISFNRCIKPCNAVGNPNMILFSDGSEVAYGCCAYIRWKLEDGTHQCHLIEAKCRIAPLKTVTIVRLELNGAVLSKRLSAFIQQESIFTFEKIFYLAD